MSHKFTPNARSHLRHTTIHKKKRTLREVFAWGMQPYKKTIVCSSVSIWKFERAIARNSRKNPRRDTVGFLRASGCTFLFNGAYKGAEND